MRSSFGTPESINFKLVSAGLIAENPIWKKSVTAYYMHIKKFTSLWMDDQNILNVSCLLTTRSKYPPLIDLDGVTLILLADLPSS